MEVRATSLTTICVIQGSSKDLLFYSHIVAAAAFGGPQTNEFKRWNLVDISTGD